MLRKYARMTEQQRQREYARLKREFWQRTGYDEEAYDAFIDRISRELGI